MYGMDARLILRNHHQRDTYAGARIGGSSAQAVWLNAQIMMLQEDVQDAVILSVVVEIVPDMLFNKFVKKNPTQILLHFNAIESSAST